MWNIIFWILPSERASGSCPLPLVKAVLPLSAPHQNKTKLLSLIVPRQPSNDLFETFEIERGVSADDEAKDDPGEILIFSVPL